MNAELLKDFGLGIIFGISQILFFQHLEVFGTTADPVTFYLLWLVAKYDRPKLLLIAALLGLFQDALFDFWGMFMFSKTLLVFLFYSFVKRRSEVQLLVWQIFIFIFLAALVHNIIFIGLSSFFDAYAYNYSPILSTFGNAIYTAVVGSLIYIFRVK
ncbi:MAG: rod shape-determining protein MreD [Balneolaceae bacterium]